MSEFDNGGSISSPSDTGERNLPRAKTMPGGANYAKKLWASTRQQILDRAKTERQKSKSHTNIRAQLFNGKISDKKKLKMLYRIATVRQDGTIDVDIPSNMEPSPPIVGSEYTFSDGEKEEVVASTDFPPLQIVILIVGTRGDVQPFVAIGKRLQEYGHRVRLATHANFREFVLTAGLEFYPLGGDSKLLAEYMVKNKSFLPSSPKEFSIHRKQMKEIIFSLLPACTKPDLDSGIPFKAEAIIANPPTFGHIHVAEALKIPIHIFFTMPWTPTSEFPHPLSRVKHPVGYRLSYQVVDSMIWLGIRDIINDFRKKQLNLRPITYQSDSDIPHGYIWSPHLVPKPKDWGPKIDVVGFCFLDLASKYEPPVDLLKWLNAGEKPIYIGFGSLPVQDLEEMFSIILQTLLETKQRAVIDKGWGDLCTYPMFTLFSSIYLLDNVPHDWLFLQCKAVVHHGGAGTTATGLKAACPTTVIPFFGDQHFWGDRVHSTGVGPCPIPVDQLTSLKLIDAINYMLKPEVKERAVEFAKCMELEDGVERAVKVFFKHLPLKMPLSTDSHLQEETPQAKDFLKCLSCT